MKPIAEYTLVEARQAVRLRGNDNQQTNTGILFQPAIPGSTFGSREGALTGAPGGGTGESIRYGIGLGGFELFNSSAGTITVALGVRLNNGVWRAGQWVDAAATPYTDDTIDAQDAAGADFALNTTTNNDGFVVHSSYPFNAIGIDVVTAGDASTNALRYSNAAGTGWSAMSTLYLSESVDATGERIWFWPTPPDWGRTAVNGLSGIPSGRYAVNFRSTTAPAATVAVADALEIYRFYFIREGVADATAWQWAPGSMEFQMVPGDGLVAFFGTANDLNHVTALVRPRV